MSALLELVGGAGGRARGKWEGWWRSRWKRDWEGFSFLFCWMLHRWRNWGDDMQWQENFSSFCSAHLKEFTNAGSISYSLLRWCLRLLERKGSWSSLVDQEQLNEYAAKWILTRSLNTQVGFIGIEKANRTVNGMIGMRRVSGDRLLWEPNHIEKDQWDMFERKQRDYQVSTLRPLVVMCGELCAIFCMWSSVFSFRKECGCDWIVFLRKIGAYQVKMIGNKWALKLKV